MLHAPYVRSFEGFRRPRHHLERLIEDVHIRGVGLGGGYIVTGQAPRPPPPGASPPGLVGPLPASPIAVCLPGIGSDGEHALANLVDRAV